MPHEAQIEKLAAESACVLTSTARDHLGIWVDLLTSWNARLDLTAARTKDELYDLMLADAFVLASRIPASVRVVDVGCGAGAPGLAIAIARPDLRVTLCEPLTKRIAFMRTVIGTIARTDIQLARAKGDALTSTYDVAISRATLAPEAWLTLAAKLTVPGGDAWVLVARESPPKHDAMTLADDVAYTWPLTKASRRALRYVRA